MNFGPQELPKSPVACVAFRNVLETFRRRGKPLLRMSACPLQRSDSRGSDVAQTALRFSDVTAPSRHWNPAGEGRPESPG